MPKTPTPEYSELPFTRKELLDDPIEQFSLWFSQAQAKGEFDPTAMTLATVNKHYDISARMVLLKGFSKDGFWFFTNYLSPKAQDIKEISQGALVFWWPLCQRQVRIKGKISVLDETLSNEYFQQRDKASQIAALISKQSSVIPDREFLMTQFESVAKEHEQLSSIPRPDFWGGYLLKPEKIEFWQGRSHRLHDRFQYTKTHQGWDIVQLSP